MLKFKLGECVTLEANALALVVGKTQEARLRGAAWLRKHLVLEKGQYIKQLRTTPMAPVPG